ncbi:hypothetical protein BDZ90DRAFT_280810 [Jaminaea rosea]|uniref:2, 3 cyclic phosphodiesterase n=1 Tax=Jaminaea rosea TaxID=1569628 RepID=A0A316ULY1_9BASI|nr:hypothetical protein BDZ90DRAFT_280810 [Jaminaea rosea]PWN26286.1 hypothetical protein BDZ90DRAFT_280810 [Jaminaea rosea]
MAGLALWLVPAPIMAGELASDRQADRSSVTIIGDLMQRIRDKVISDPSLPPASSPFPPHATLLSGLKADDGTDNGKRDELWSKALRVVSGWRKAGQHLSSTPISEVETRVESLVTRGWYFQILVLALELTEPLLKLNELARQTLLPETIKAAPPYFPHVSLLYSDATVEQARGLISELKKEDDGTFMPKSICFTHLELWDCNGDVGRWHRLERVGLAQVPLEGDSDKIGNS